MKHQSTRHMPRLRAWVALLAAVLGAVGALLTVAIPASALDVPRVTVDGKTVTFSEPEGATDFHVYRDGSLVADVPPTTADGWMFIDNSTQLVPQNIWVDSITDGKPHTYQVGSVYGVGGPESKSFLASDSPQNIHTFRGEVCWDPVPLISSYVVSYSLSGTSYRDNVSDTCWDPPTNNCYGQANQTCWHAPNSAFFGCQECRVGVGVVSASREVSAEAISPSFTMLPSPIQPLDYNYNGTDPQYTKSPAVDCTANDRPILHWNPVPGAVGYNVYIRDETDDSNQTHAKLMAQNVSGTTWTDNVTPAPGPFGQWLIDRGWVTPNYNAPAFAAGYLVTAVAQDGTESHFSSNTILYANGATLNYCGWDSAWVTEHTTLGPPVPQGAAVQAVGSGSSSANRVSWNAYNPPAPPEWSVTPATFTFSYDVYRDGTRIAAGITGTTFTDQYASLYWNHTYTVSVVVNGLESKQSAPITAPALLTASSGGGLGGGGLNPGGTGSHHPISIM